MNIPTGLILLVGAFSFGFCYVLTPISGWMSRYLGILDRPGGHKSHDERTPLLGGVAIFVSVWGTLFLLYLFGNEVLEVTGMFPWDTQLLGIFLGSIIILAMGVIDDAWRLPPITKFIVQCGAATIVIFHQVVLSLFIGTNLITILLTLLWIVGITNSFNLLDNMDGLTTGVAGICCLIFALVAFRQQDHQTLFLSIAMLGSLAAFLRFNFDPAEIFMGDAGSGFVGFYLGCLAVSANYLENSQLEFLPIISPILIFSVPLFDTFSVIAIRILEGRPIWEPDNNHFSHRLVSLGISRRGAVLIIYLITLTVGILATLLTRVNLSDAILLLVHAAAIFAIIILLEYAGASRQDRESSA